MRIRGCGPQLPGTHRVQEFLLTQGKIGEAEFLYIAFNFYATSIYMI